MDYRMLVILASHRARVETGGLNSVKISALNEAANAAIRGLRYMGALEAQYSKRHPERKEYYRFVVDSYAYAAAQRVGTM
jgi:hypothetical protein